MEGIATASFSSCSQKHLMKKCCKSWLLGKAWSSLSESLIIFQLISLERLSFLAFCLTGTQSLTWKAKVSYCDWSTWLIQALMQKVPRWRRIQNILLWSNHYEILGQGASKLNGQQRFFWMMFPASHQSLKLGIHRITHQKHELIATLLESHTF